MKNKIEWINVKDALPEKNGDYPVYGISMRGAQPEIRIATFYKATKYNAARWSTHYPYLTVLMWAYPIEKPENK